MRVESACVCVCVCVCVCARAHASLSCMSHVPSVMKLYLLCVPSCRHGGTCSSSGNEGQRKSFNEQ